MRRLLATVILAGATSLCDTTWPWMQCEAPGTLRSLGKGVGLAIAPLRNDDSPPAQTQRFTKGLTRETPSPRAIKPWDVWANPSRIRVNGP